MSLLLDALKKSGDAETKPRSSGELQLEEVPPSSRQPSAHAEVSEQQPAATATRPNTYASNTNAASNMASRAAGENLFAAKKPAPKKKRKPLGIVPIAVILGSITGLVGGIYVYWEITPPNQRPFYSPPEPVVAAITPPPAPAPTVVTTAPVLVPMTPTPVAAASVEEKSIAPVTEVEKTAEMPKPVAKSKRARKAPKMANAPRTATAQAATPPRGLAIERKQEPNSIDQLLSSAYQAYQSGDYATAWQRYREALVKEPKNRDALLGLAAISQQQGQDDSALYYYRQVLQLDPRDPVALAGIAAFGTGDRSNKESQLKQLISQQPDSAALHYALGNQYVEQSRWSDAQQEFFNALAIEPSNALFAFNLAVSLDHLGQRKSAARYYQQALQFDTTKTAGFNHEQTQQRLNALNATK